jgi:hypothetical protein
LACASRPKRTTAAARTAGARVGAQAPGQSRTAAREPKSPCGRISSIASKQRIDRRVDDAVRELALDQLLDHADEQSAATQPTASPGRRRRADEALDRDRDAARAADERDRSDDRAAEGGERDRDTHADRARAVDVDADQARAGGLLAAARIALPKVGALEEEIERAERGGEQAQDPDLLRRDLENPRCPRGIAGAAAEEGQGLGQTAPDQRVPVEQDVDRADARDGDGDSPARAAGRNTTRS